MPALKAWLLAICSFDDMPLTVLLKSPWPYDDEGEYHIKIIQEHTFKVASERTNYVIGNWTESLWFMLGSSFGLGVIKMTVDDLSQSDRTRTSAPEYEYK